MTFGKSRRRLVRGAATCSVTFLGLVLGACSSSPSSSSSTSSSSTVPASSTGTTVSASKSAQYGTILVSASGMTLYMLTGDSPTTSICTGACPPIWPRLSTTGAPKAGSGVDAKLLGTITRSDGTREVTYNGHPLYTFSKDTAAGQVNGEGINHFGGIWYVLNASGQPVTAPVSATSTSTTGY